MKEAPIELYIDMLEAAIEIQEHWEPKDGDLVGPINEPDLCQNHLDLYFEWMSTGQDGEFMSEDEKSTEGIKNAKRCYLYFPDQAAYQRMLGEHPIHANSSAIGLIRVLVLWNTAACMFPGQRPLQRNNYLTMDMLWLGVVMSHIYLKRWNGVEWLKMGDGYEDAPEESIKIYT